jgi:hypothetical protein
MLLYYATLPCLSILVWDDVNGIVGDEWFDSWMVCVVFAERSCELTSCNTNLQWRRAFSPLTRYDGRDIISCDLFCGCCCSL